MDEIKYSIPLPKLKNDFQFWMMQFQSYATVKKFGKTIKDKKDPDLPLKEGDKLKEGESRETKESIG